MENFYTLSDKFASISETYDKLSAELDEIYSENGGEAPGVGDNTGLREQDEAESAGGPPGGRRQS